MQNIPCPVSKEFLTLHGSGKYRCALLVGAGTRFTTADDLFDHLETLRADGVVSGPFRIDGNTDTIVIDCVLSDGLLPSRVEVRLQVRDGLGFVVRADTLSTWFDERRTRRTLARKRARVPSAPACRPVYRVDPVPMTGRRLGVGGNPRKWPRMRADASAVHGLMHDEEAVGLRLSARMLRMVRALAVPPWDDPVRDSATRNWKAHRRHQWKPPV